MSEPPKLEYATAPPDRPARGRRVALGVAGTAAYALLLAPCAYTVWDAARSGRGFAAADDACPGLIGVVCAWRLTAAVVQLCGGLGRRHRG